MSNDISQQSRYYYYFQQSSHRRKSKQLKWRWVSARVLDQKCAATLTNAANITKLKTSCELETRFFFNFLYLLVLYSINFHRFFFFFAAVTIHRLL